MTISNLVAGVRRWMKRTATAGLLTYHLAVEPAPASRPRVTRFNGVYYGKGYSRFKTAADQIASTIEMIPTDRPLVVMLECVCTKPKTTGFTYPRQADADNLAKGPLDVLNKRLWADDKQIVGLIVFKRFAEEGETAGVTVTWFEADI